MQCCLTHSSGVFTSHFFLTSSKISSPLSPGRSWKSYVGKLRGPIVWAKEKSFAKRYKGKTKFRGEVDDQEWSQNVSK